MHLLMKAPALSWNVEWRVWTSESQVCPESRSPGIHRMCGILRSQRWLKQKAGCRTLCVIVPGCTQHASERLRGPQDAFGCLLEFSAAHCQLHACAQLVKSVYIYTYTYIYGVLRRPIWTWTSRTPGTLIWGQCGEVGMYWLSSDYGCF